MRNKVLNTIAVIIVTIGGFLLIGTVNAMERETIESTHAIVTALIGLGTTVLGCRLFKATYNPSDYNYEDDENDVDE